MQMTMTTIFILMQLSDTIPDFSSYTSAGPIRLYDYMGGRWAILFSHPADFTPVCTTELGAVARLMPEFTKRNTVVIALSVDPLQSHVEWIKDIEETQLSCNLSDHRRSRVEIIRGAGFRASECFRPFHRAFCADHIS